MRIIHQGREFGPSTSALFVAANLEGAVSLWNRWSIDRYPTAHFNFAQSDIVFTWGQFGTGYYNAHDFTYRALFETGMIGADRNAGTIHKTDSIRNHLSPTVSFAITLFDSNVDPRTQHDMELLVSFYRELFKAIEIRQNWGLLIKSKGPTYREIPEAAGIHAVGKGLKKEGRLIELEPETPISVAADAGDFTLSFSINSPGIVAAVFGHHSLHVDTPGNIENPLYSIAPKNTIIVESVATAVNAMEKFCAGDRNIGDNSSFIRAFDSFGDGKGPDRAGEVITKFIQLTEPGILTPDEALNIIVGEYRKKWGHQYARYYSDTRDTHLDQLWLHANADLEDS